MRTIVIYSGLTALLLTLAPVGAKSEFTRVKDPTPEQQCVLLGVEREIVGVQLKIQAYYKDLLDDPCAGEEGGDPRAINCRFYRIGKSGVVVVPLTSDKQSYYGRRARFFLKETGWVQWNKNKIASFRFEARRSQVGSGGTLIKTIASTAQIPAKDPGSLDLEECLKTGIYKTTKANTELDLIVREILPSGRTGTFTFRFPTKKDVTIRNETRLIDGKRQTIPVSYVRDKTETMVINGSKEKVNVAYVRDFQQKISLSREYLRLLRLTLRRIDWNTRAGNFRRAAEIERVLHSR